MLKVTLGTLTTIFGIVASIIIFYWRDIGFEPTSKDLFLIFIVLPILLTIGVLSPLYITKWVEYRKEKEEKNLNSAQKNENLDKVEENLEPAYIQLKLYNSSCIHTFGENKEIKRLIQESVWPELDDELTNQYGLPIVSYRIKNLKKITFDQDDVSYHSDFQVRMMSLIQHQLEQYTLEIQSVIEHIKQSTLFYNRQLAYEYKIHPAWLNSDLKILNLENVEEEVLQEISKLSYFNVHLILAESVLHSFDEVFIFESIKEQLFNLGILKQQVNINFHYCKQNNAYKNWFELMKTLENVLDEVSLIIVADSEINQDIIDGKQYIKGNYIPAEFACGCLISSPNLVVENLTPIKNLYIIENENNLNNSLEKLNIKNAPQFENEQPFVVLLDSIDGAKISKQINQFFSSTLIETQHFLLSKQSLGHTQTLSEIWGMMLGTQIAEDEFNLVFSTKYPEIQVFILPYEPNNAAVKD